jgi:hypothetical protein
MNNDGDLADDVSQPLIGALDADKVITRAEGRPPEEESSENPEAQAEAILKESEDRIEEGAEASEPI